jgi:hypothetical protein
VSHSIRAIGYKRAGQNGIFAGILFNAFGPRDWATSRNAASDQTTQMPILQALRETGATGLEPATSGVTGRYGLNRHSRLPPGFTG